MAWGNFLLDKGFDAAAAIGKYMPVKFSAAETVTPVTAITDNPIGWSQYAVTADEIAAGKGCSVRVWGVTEAVAGGQIGIGVMCQLETTGKVTAYTGSSGKRIVGMCVGNPSTNDGDRIAMLLVHGAAVA